MCLDRTESFAGSLEKQRMDDGGKLRHDRMACPPDFGKELRRLKKSMCYVYYHFHFVFLSAELRTTKGEGIGGLEERKPS